MTDPTPQPGDVVRFDGDPDFDVLIKPQARAVIDGSHFELDLDNGRGPYVLICFGASAFRGPSSAYAEDQTPYVSCSGGPAPLVAISELQLVGTTEQVFWRWKDRPRADGGENYTLTVNLWSWGPERKQR